MQSDVSIFPFHLPVPLLPSSLLFFPPFASFFYLFELVAEVKPFYNGVVEYVTSLLSLADQKYLVFFLRSCLFIYSDWQVASVTGETQLRIPPEAC